MHEIIELTHIENVLSDDGIAVEEESVWRKGAKRRWVGVRSDN